MIDDIVSNILDTLDGIRDMVFHIVLSGNPLFFQDDVDENKYDITKKKRSVITVSVTGNKYFMEVSGELQAEYVDNESVEYMILDNSVEPVPAPAIIRIGSKKYAFPPTDVSSYIFYNINKEITNEVKKHLVRKGWRETVQKYDTTNKLAYKREPLLKLEDTGIYSYGEVYGTIAYNTGDSMLLLSSSIIGEKDTIYDVHIRRNNRNIKFKVISDYAVETLAEILSSINVLSDKELSRLTWISEIVLLASRHAYIVFNELTGKKNTIPEQY